MIFTNFLSRTDSRTMFPSGSIEEDVVGEVVGIIVLKRSSKYSFFKIHGSLEAFCQSPRLREWWLSLST